MLPYIKLIMFLLKFLILRKRWPIALNSEIKLGWMLFLRQSNSTKLEKHLKLIKF